MTFGTWPDTEGYEVYSGTMKKCFEQCLKGSAYFNQIITNIWK